MLFIKVDSIQPVADYLDKLISKRLGAGDKVLWLVAGGSAMDIAVAVAKKLGGIKDIENLTVTLTDERYGAVGHADSNWRKLQEKGFGLAGAKLSPVLTGDSLDLTAQKYADLLQAALTNSNYSLALAGMGPDGHIFGIKPSSPAVDSHQPVVGYEWDDFVRLTPTIELIKKIDEIVIYAMGQEKWSQLDNLAKKLEPKVQPAQLLKQLNKVTIYNDYKGGTP